MGTSLDEEQGAGVNASLSDAAHDTSKAPRVAKPFQGAAAVMQALEADLRRNVRGEVRFDQGSKALYAADASNYRQVPLAVVVPSDVDDLLETLAACRRNDVPFLPRGGGTSQNGQCVNVAVVADASKYVNRVVSVDPVAGVAIVEPGVICDTLRDAAEAHGLTFAPDPATHSRCTLGGMIANNSCGAHSVMAGKTVENVEALEIATFDGARFWVGPTPDDELERIIAAGGRQGEIYAALKQLRDTYADQIRAKFPQIKRRVSGFNLDQLLPENGFNVARALVGTEGTCAVTLQAKVRLVKSPAKRVIVVVGFTDIYTAADAVPHFMRCGPIAIEGLDRAIIRGLQARGLKKDEIALLPEGDAWVVLEFGADTQDDAVHQAQTAEAYFSSGAAGPNVSAMLVEDRALQAKVWSIRETGASAVALSVDAGTPDPVVGWEDAAVDPMRLGDYLRAFQALVDRYGYETSLYGHFGDGCVHARITFDLRSVEGVATWRKFLREAAELVVEFGGSLSGEHGDGQAKAEFLPIMYGPELMQAMEQFKAIWDPANRLNPGKVVHAYRADENLRMGPAYKPVTLQTKLTFASQEGDGFQREIERCIGMGKCRSLEGGTMCPSFRATREEKFSTRGRAHLFWEMLQGDVITDGWQSREVKEALDTCLACKGCKSDCPTHTDMASYKAEFLSHYYETNRRPRQALFMGRIGEWAPWAARFPRFTNFMTSAPGLAAVGKWVAGVAQARELPKFATRTYRQIARRSPQTELDARSRSDVKKVILWVDTFNDHFTPEIAQAAADVLTQMGWHVVLPKNRLCCGRPLYDFGLLDRARELLTTILDDLGEDIAAGVPLVGLEPGCLSVFKDELLKQFPDHALATQLSAQTFLFSDFVARQPFDWPTLAADVIVHGHCHQKALFGMQGDTALLNKLGVKWKLLDTGCCGMAGSFGFNDEHHALSEKIGEDTLFPAVRAAAAANAETIVLTNGFSCREQIEQETGQHAMHIAQLAQRALAARR
ncbi:MULTISPECIES: FAD-binding and (Fe-S)-binding domain-containing protein [Paraburkholderia]|uniref:FAD-binding and (Fe-S)-binding domain-containing protein n=1 Tax=Paraburkholderia madseniana TaxID=2599607 RepID=A0AAP5B6P5_9BURK|nr:MULTISPECIES: FAD-binding and (Fe-S)-binding domain-containing protein [Paraburkholderia]MCX4143884.1 FAD-binding and (Fe-S)-binding domain-containing protein [Paraburkholderia madseniana]MDN7146838.1 FAD-binding oxidoreductase [Paraburkholderia sp. WS6]MDQ6405718.1 FAD-binding oxidoreductase [Paraburkholderia madseniana]